MTGDKDIFPCLSWCEERVGAMSDALTMDTGKTTTTSLGVTDEQQSFSARQVQLATLGVSLMLYLN